MERNLEFFEKFYEIRIRAGKAHLFHSVNKSITRIGLSQKLDNIYISKEYLAYLSEKMFGDKNRLGSFFAGKNTHIRLSLIDEFAKDYGRDIVKEIKDDFMELKIYNSSIFSEVRARLEAIMASEDKKIEIEDMVLFENYLSNWKRLENRIRSFIPKDFYGKKKNYFYNSLLSYVRYFEKYKENYKVVSKFLENK